MYWVERTKIVLDAEAEEARVREKMRRFRGGDG
jgi:hypothetical protein